MKLYHWKILKCVISGKQLIIEVQSVSMMGWRRLGRQAVSHELSSCSNGLSWLTTDRSRRFRWWSPWCILDGRYPVPVTKEGWCGRRDGTGTQARLPERRGSQSQRRMPLSGPQLTQRFEELLTTTRIPLAYGAGAMYTACVGAMLETGADHGWRWVIQKL